MSWMRGAKGILPLIIFFVLELPTQSECFGKYLQAHLDRRQKLSKSSADDSESSVAAAVLQIKPEATDGTSWEAHNPKSSLSKQLPSDDNEQGLDIEVAAAIFLSGIFVAFILVYVVFLQCWWKFRECRAKRKPPAAIPQESGGLLVGNECLCVSPKAWEPMDVHQHFFGKIESVTNGPNGTKVVTLTTKEQFPDGCGLIGDFRPTSSATTTTTTTTVSNLYDVDDLISNPDETEAHHPRPELSR